MTISKKDVAEACAVSFQRGYTEGIAAGRSMAEKEREGMSAEVVGRLADSVGQAMNVNSSLLEGLGRIVQTLKGRV